MPTRFDPVAEIYDIAVLLGRNGYLKSEQTCIKIMEYIKHLEAKLLTFEEVKKHYSIPGELLADIRKYVDYMEDIEPLYLECKIEDEGVVHWRIYESIADRLDDWKEDYGKTWRCWTAKPTFAQRMEAKWE